MIPNKLGIMEICDPNTSPLHPMTVKGYLNDSIKVEVEKCWDQDASLAYSTSDQEPLDTFPYILTPAEEPASTAWIPDTTLAGRTVEWSKGPHS